MPDEGRRGPWRPVSRAAAVLTVFALAVAGGAGRCRAICRRSSRARLLPAGTAGAPRDQGHPGRRCGARPRDGRAPDRSGGTPGGSGAPPGSRTDAVRRRAQEHRRTGQQQTASTCVGVNKSIGRTVDFSPADGLGERTRPLAAGAARGDGQGGFVWTAAVRAPGATAIRVRLTGLDLPEGAELYVYNLAGQAFGPYTGRGPLGDRRAVHQHRVRRPAAAPAPAAGWRRARSAAAHRGGRRHGRALRGAALQPRRRLRRERPRRRRPGLNLCSYNAACVVNAACQSSAAVNTAKDAVASILFPSGGSHYICTGGLIADTVATSVIPYFLTANHCISSSGEAASLETYFDYATTCSSPNCTQPYNNAGDTVGSTIMATAAPATTRCCGWRRRRLTAGRRRRLPGLAEHAGRQHQQPGSSTASATRRARRRPIRSSGSTPARAPAARCRAAASSTARTPWAAPRAAAAARRSSTAPARSSASSTAPAASTSTTPATPPPTPRSTAPSPPPIPAWRPS